MNNLDVVITVDEKHLNQINQVADELSRAGCKVKDIHKNIGIISGSVAPAMRSKLTSIKGVIAVEDDRTVQLPPPESEIQ